MTKLSRSATDRQLVMGIIGALSLHPAIKNPPVFYPVLRGDQNPKQVFVDKYRTFGGMEIIESGLTIAVYPMHTGYNSLTSSPDANSRDSYANFEAYTLGKPSNLSFLSKGTLKFIIQIYYRDANFNAAYKVTYGKKDVYGLEDLFYTFDRQYYTPPDSKSELSEWSGNSEELELYISPGEEVIRDYTYLVRNVLREIGSIPPFGIKQITVDSVDYPSSDWIRNNQNVVFHTSYICLSIQVFERPLAKDAYYVAPVWAEEYSQAPFYAKEFKEREEDFVDRPEPG